MFKSFVFITAIIVLSLAQPDVLYVGNYTNLIGTQAMYENGNLQWWNSGNENPIWWVFNKSSNYLSQILPNGNSCNNAGMNFWMNSNQEFFCINSACQGCANPTINQVNPVTMQIIKSYPYSGPNYANISFANDIIMLSNAQFGGRNVTIDLFDTISGQLITSKCPFQNQIQNISSGFVQMFPYPYSGFLLYISYNFTQYLTGVNLVNYTCGTAQSTFATLNTFNDEFVVYPLQNGSQIVLGTLTSEFFSIQPASANPSTGPVVGTQFELQGYRTLNWGGPINSTHIAVILYDQYQFVNGIGYYTFNSTNLAMQRTGFFELSPQQNIELNSAFIFAGTNNMILSSENLVVEFNPFSSQFLYASSQNPQFTFINGSVVVYDFWAYWVEIPNQNYWTFTAAPLTSSLQYPTQTDFLWFFYTPNLILDSIPPYYKCTLIQFQGSTNTISTIYLNYCPCAHEDTSNQANLQNVVPLGNGNFNVTYQCTLSNLYIVNNTNTLGTWSLTFNNAVPNPLATFYPNLANNTINAFIPNTSTGVYDVQVTDMNSGQIYYSLNVQNFPYSPYVALSNNFALYWKLNEFSGIEFIVYDLSKLAIATTFTIPQTLSSTSTVVPIGINMSEVPAISAFAAVDANNDAFYYNYGEAPILLVDGETANSVQIVMMNDNIFAVGVMTQDVSYETYEVYQVLGFSGTASIEN